MGCAALQVLPMFLGAGGHVRKDLPLLVPRAGRAPADAGHLTTAVGELPSVADHGRCRRGHAAGTAA
jgi:sirohydrochlorin cobaltochelatase